MFTFSTLLIVCLFSTRVHSVPPIVLNTDPLSVNALLKHLPVLESGTVSPASAAIPPPSASPPLSYEFAELIHFIDPLDHDAPEIPAADESLCRVAGYDKPFWDAEFRAYTACCYNYAPTGNVINTWKDMSKFGSQTIYSLAITSHLDVGDHVVYGDDGNHHIGLELQGGSGSPYDHPEAANNVLASASLLDQINPAPVVMGDLIKGILRCDSTLGPGYIHVGHGGGQGGNEGGGQGGGFTSFGSCDSPEEIHDCRQVIAGGSGGSGGLRGHQSGAGALPSFAASGYFLNGSVAVESKPGQYPQDGDESERGGNGVGGFGGGGGGKYGGRAGYRSSDAGDAVYTYGGAGGLSWMEDWIENFMSISPGKSAAPHALITHYSTSCECVRGYRHQPVTKFCIPIVRSGGGGSSSSSSSSPEQLLTISRAATRGSLRINIAGQKDTLPGHGRSSSMSTNAPDSAASHSEAFTHSETQSEASSASTTRKNSLTSEPGLEAIESHSLDEDEQEEDEDAGEDMGKEDPILLLAQQGTAASALVPKPKASRQLLRDFERLGL